jgi:hypothetical protein
MTEPQKKLTLHLTPATAGKEPCTRTKGREEMTPVIVNEVFRNLGIFETITPRCIDVGEIHRAIVSKNYITVYLHQQPEVLKCAVRGNGRMTIQRGSGLVPHLLNKQEFIEARDARKTYFFSKKFAKRPPAFFKAAVRHGIDLVRKILPGCSR